MTGKSGLDKTGLGEFGRIGRYLMPLAAGYPGALGLSDDAALLDGGERVVTMDAIVAGVHFLPDDPPDLVARKLLRVNLSDLAAMGATPEAYFLTLALPPACDDSWVERFAAGLAQDQVLFGCHLAGGDSVGTPGPVTLAVTAIGRAPQSGAVRRSGAKAGDIVFVSGTLGDGALGLLAVTGRLGDVAPESRRYLEDRYRLPQPRVALGPALAPHVHAMLDVSDGLMADLGHIAETSGVAIAVETERLPLSLAAAEAIAADLDRLELVLGGGDDYELAFTAPPEAEPALRAAARAAGTDIASIGRVEAGSGVAAFDRDGRRITVARAGYSHG